MRERERRLAAAYCKAGAAGDVESAVAQSIRSAIDALVVAHQSNIDLSGAERLDAFRDAMRARCRELRDDADTAAALDAAIEDAICQSPRWEPPNLLPGAEAALTDLRRRGLRIAVVSNTGLAPGAYVEAALRDRGWGDWVDAWIWSDDVRSWKPGPAIFAACAQALEVSPTETVFIGDTPEADIIGASYAGFAATVLVGGKDPAGAEPTLRLAGVGDLTAALERLGYLQSDHRM